jgi:hypothetical protein
MASTEINVKLSIVTKAFEDSVQRMMAQLGLMARRFREAGWMSPYWVGNRKCKRGEASVWLRHKLPGAWRFRGAINVWYPTTAELRRIMNDKTTPRGVKCHVYSMLRVRRQR